MGKMLEMLRASDEALRKELGSLMTIKTGRYNEKSIYDLQNEIQALQEKNEILQQRNAALNKSIGSLTKKLHQVRVLDNNVKAIDFKAINDLRDAEEMICKVFNVKYDFLFVQSRASRNIMTAKHICRFIALVGFNMPLSAVAKRYNKANHTTMIHSRNSIYSWYEQDMPNTVVHLINTCCGLQIFEPK